MPIDNRSGIRDADELPTSAWDDIVQNSLGSGQTRIYEEAGVVWDFYYQVYNGGITGWIANLYFFRIHDVRNVLVKIGGAATHEIEDLLTQILPFLNFQLDPLMEPNNPLFYQQRAIRPNDSGEWEGIREVFDKRLLALKQEFRREAEEYFASHWHHFN